VYLWREEWVNSNWLNINEDLVYKKIICCTNVNGIRLLGKYLRSNVNERIKLGGT
jgi:hypothetical protein